MSDETCDVCGVILRGTRFYDSLYRKEIKCCSLACWREVFEAENTKHWIPKNIEDEKVMTLDDLAREIREINEANGWNVYSAADWDNRYRIPAILALVHSEVSEALEAFRKSDTDNFLEEMADVVIRVLDCVGGMTDDFDGVLREKLEYNRTRGYRHGGKKV